MIVITEQNEQREIAKKIFTTEVRMISTAALECVDEAEP